MSSYLDWTLLRSAAIPKGAYHSQDLNGLAAFTLESEKVGGPVSIALDLTSPVRIHRLNRHFRGVDRTTDVISFRYEPETLASPSARRQVGMLAGDIAINVVQANLQARRVGHSLRREIRLLLIHGILHLLEYTDYAAVPRRRMFKRQNELLRRWERQHP